MKIKIKVTETHIARGIPKKEQSCPKQIKYK